MAGSILRSRRDPPRPGENYGEHGEDDVQPVSREDYAAVRWMNDQGIDPRDYTPAQRAILYRAYHEDIPGTGAVPGSYQQMPEHVRQTIESLADDLIGHTGGERAYGNDNPIPMRPTGNVNVLPPPERTPEWYDQQYGHWGSLIRQLEGGQDWGPYRRLEAQQRLEALGPDLVREYGHGFDPTAGLESDDFSGERNTEPNYNPEEGDGSPWAPLLESTGRESDTMPLPFLDPRSDEERAAQQAMAADRARQQGGGRQPPSAARRWGVLPPNLQMAAAQGMPGPNTLASSADVPSEGVRPPFPTEWDVNNPEHRQRHFEDVYKSLLDQQLAAFPGATNPQGGAATYEDLPRVGPGSAYSQGRNVVRPGDVGLPSFWENADTTTGDRAGQMRSDWLAAHPEYQIAQDFTDQEHYPVDIPAEGEPGNRRGENGFGWSSGHFGGDETDRFWAGPQAGVSKNDQGRLNAAPQMPGPNTAMGPTLPTGDEDMRPWWIRMLDQYSGGPARWGGETNYPPLGALGPATPKPTTPPYDWAQQEDQPMHPSQYGSGGGGVGVAEPPAPPPEWAQEGGKPYVPGEPGPAIPPLPHDSGLPGSPNQWVWWFQHDDDFQRAMDLHEEYKRHLEEGTLPPGPDDPTGGALSAMRGSLRSPVPQLGGFGVPRGIRQLGGYGNARPMPQLGGFGRPRSLPTFRGYQDTARIPTSTDFTMARMFSTGPHHSPFDGMLDALERNKGNIGRGAAIGAAAAGAIASGIGRTISPFGG